MTAWQSWHVENFVAINFLQTQKSKNAIDPSNLNHVWRIFGELGHWSQLPPSQKEHCITNRSCVVHFANIRKAATYVVMSILCIQFFPLLWRHNGRGSISNHQPHECLLSRLFRCRSKKTSKLRITGLCAGNSPGTGEFPTQMASNAENVSIWWSHHASQNFIISLLHICAIFQYESA